MYNRANLSGIEYLFVLSNRSWIPNMFSLKIWGFFFKKNREMKKKMKLTLKSKTILSKYQEKKIMTNFGYEKDKIKYPG